MIIPGRTPVYVTADLVILTVREDLLQVLVVERDNEPFRGWLALPGGFVRATEDPAMIEDVHTTAKRELSEETGLDGDALHLEQLAVYSMPGRDPRGPVISVAFLAIAPDLPVPEAGSDARAATWAPVQAVRDKLAFDHKLILDDAVERARRHLELTTLAVAFCGPEFTMGDLRRIYEVVWGMELDPRNFSRKVLHTESFVEPTGAKRSPQTGRPAELYRRGRAQVMNPPMLRSHSAQSH